MRRVPLSGFSLTEFSIHLLASFQSKSPEPQMLCGLLLLLHCVPLKSCQLWKTGCTLLSSWYPSFNIIDFSSDPCYSDKEKIEFSLTDLFENLFGPSYKIVSNH